jgi:hypothetical protein
VADPLDSSRYSVEHAKRRIAEFDGEATVFFNSQPYQGVIERNANGTQERYKFKLVKPMPAALQGIAFDALNSLRSALDQAAFACAVAAGRNGKNAKFPFSAHAADMKGKVTGYSNGKGRSKDIPKEVFDFMAACRPYRGGNDLLWALNELANSHKHEIVTPVAIAADQMLVDHAEFSGRAEIGFPRWDRVKQEIVIATVNTAHVKKLDVKVRTFIAIAKVDVVAGKPAVGILNELTRMVDGILGGVEAESRRIGLFSGD